MAAQKHRPVTPATKPESNLLVDRIRFDFIGSRNIAFAISISVAVIFWAICFAQGGLKYGIDFTGGIQHVFKFNRNSTSDLLAEVRDAALTVDPSAQVQNIGKPEEGEVVIQVKGFDLVEKATAEVSRAPITSREDLKDRLSKFELFDQSFFERIRSDTELRSNQWIRDAIADQVNTVTALRLNTELGKRFGAGYAEGREDLNRLMSAHRMVESWQKHAMDRLSAALIARIATTTSMSDLSAVLDAAGLDPRPFEEKFLLRAPTLEEIKTDLHEFAGAPDKLAKVLFGMYPQAYLAEFRVSAEKVVAQKEMRGLFKTVDEAAAFVEGPRAGLLRDILSESYCTGAFVLIKTDQISSRIGAELREKAVMVITLSMLAMLAYIWLRFEFRYGVGAVVTLLHDSLTVIPMMSVLGYEYDINLIAAILTLIGYSLNDTIVVYDRIRENMSEMRGSTLKEIINRSVIQTLSRTVVTGITTLLAVLTLFFFGGPVLEGFALSLFIGILVGTYSSIFVSAPVVYLWPVKR